MANDQGKIEQNTFTLIFKDKELEREFRDSYDSSVRLPLRKGIIISIVSWFSALWLIYVIIPKDFLWLGTLTLVYIGSYFGFLVYATYDERFRGYYHILGAISNAWAGLYTIYFCDQFPNGQHLVLPVIIFIIFFGAYMVRLRWIAAFVAASTYIIAYNIYIFVYADLTYGQVIFDAFVSSMVLVFAIFAGRVAEENNRLAYVQRKTIREQSEIIEREKEFLLKEVHHRVKNNLQVISSLLNLQLSKISNVEVESALREAQSRVLSMSLVHQRMHQSSNFSEISLKDYSKQLIENIQEHHPLVKVNMALTISEDISIDIETSIPLGLIINEMVSDFFRGCKPKGENEFSLSVIQDQPGNYIINYQDNRSDGFEPMNANKDTSLSLDLIEVLSSQINGEFKFHCNGGRVYEIRAKW